MANKKKFYAVKKGNATGVFESWEECQKAISGFSGPEFKSFNTEAEAKAYLNDEDIVLKNDILPRLEKSVVVAFVDGSYNQQKKIYGYGAYIFAPQLSEPLELCGIGSNEKYLGLNNIAGEVLGAINAIDWAWKNGFSKIAIFHDYDGIEKWANGEWNANQPLSQFYHRFIQDKKDFIQIEFVKVNGHSNNQYNDRADLLAKSSVNENKVIKDSQGNSGYIIQNVREQLIETLILRITQECVGLTCARSAEANKKIFIVTLNNEKVTLSLFNNIKLMVQGKRGNLFQIITTSIIENFDCGNFIYVLQNAYEIRIDNNRIALDYKQQLPLLQTIALPTNIERLLKQSIIDLNNPGYGDNEFSKYTLAALRALEGVLKFNLSKCCIPMNSTSFNMFTKVGSIYKLQQGYANSISSDRINKIENCYNYYYNQRHTLCHFGFVIAEVDTNTRMINSKEEANSIIRDTLKVINDNYIQ